MLFSKWFKSNVKFKSTEKHDVIKAKHSDLVGYLNLYINGTLVFSRIEGADTFSYLSHKMKYCENNYREALKTEILIWCEKNGYACESELNCCGYESITDFFSCVKGDNTVNIAVVKGTHSHPIDKARIFSEMVDLKEVKGVFENSQFVY